MAHRDQLRQRVYSFYQAHAPEKLNTLDSIIDRHIDQPDALMEALVDKYGPEPPPPPGATYAQQPPVSRSNQDASPPPRRRNSVVESGTLRPGSPSGGGGSGSGAGGGGGGGDDVVQELREFALAKGFLTPEHEQRWEEACLGQIPLSTICKTVSEVIFEGWGYKYSSTNRMFPKWQKRYFVIMRPFMYYFENDNLATPCRGAVYLPGATVAEIEAFGRTGIEVQPQVARKPSAIKGQQDYGSYILYFDDERLQRKIVEVIKRLSAAAMQKKSSARARSNSRREDASPARAAPPAGVVQPVVVQRQLPISRDELNMRIRRVASERDPAAVVDMVLSFVEAEIPDTLVLWRLMDAIESVRKMAPQDSAMMSPNRRATPPSVPAMPMPSPAAPLSLQERTSANRMLLSASAQAPLPPRMEGFAEAGLKDPTALQPSASSIDEFRDALAPTGSADSGSPAFAAATSMDLSPIKQTQDDMQALMNVMKQQAAASAMLQQQLQQQTQMMLYAQQQQLHTPQVQAAVMPPYAMSRTEGLPRQTSLDLSPAPSTAQGIGQDTSIQYHNNMALSPIGAQYQSPPEPQRYASTTGDGYSPGYGDRSRLQSSQVTMHSDATSPAGVHLTQRLERMRSRKKVLDEMMRDLPQ